MAKPITTAKANPIRPLYAAVGGVDIAVAKARTGLTDVQTRLNDVQTRLSKVDVEPKALVGQGRTLVVARVDELQKVANTLPARVEAKINELVAELGGTVEDINKQYVELAVRGKEPGRPHPQAAGHPGPEGRGQEDHHPGQDHDHAGQEDGLHREVVRQGHRHLREEDRRRRQEGHPGRRRQDRRLSSTAG